MRMSLLTKAQIKISRHTSKDLLLVINLLTFVQNTGTYAIDLRILDISGYRYGYLLGYVIRQKGRVYVWSDCNTGKDKIWRKGMKEWRVGERRRKYIIRVMKEFLEIIENKQRERAMEKIGCNRCCDSHSGRFYSDWNQLQLLRKQLKTSIFTQTIDKSVAKVF